MFEIDFLPVESDQGGGTKSGDAIGGRVWLDDGSSRVFVVDGGFSAVGEDLVEHIETYYSTDHVDLVVSTHPDADHLNGLLYVIENMSVGELLIHRPRDHMSSADSGFFTNIEKVDAVIAAAAARGVTVTEPFCGLVRWDGRFRVLGPTKDYYEELIRQSVDDERSGAAAKARAAKAMRAMVASGTDLLHRALSFLPHTETLAENPETTHRNNSSTIITITDTKTRILLTGDAGVPALEHAALEYERHYGGFDISRVALLQVPHHGSRRNLSPSILDRIVGPRGIESEVKAIVSSAKASPKHPSPKVVNALLRRGAYVVATEGRTVCYQSGLSRPGWSSIESLGPLDESD
ncbi:hypothetical protein QSJ19_02970 [Gordonia sp. ABSL11-1]|uniref:hypothetical protein n=1 Tax=Gordonia sp. ABSL11-1 TaxID=3053924 RepID=UPI002573A505|nr:hypothetical protein [Gordonia sp. ABSL11-1]MDL9944561.1 hypothetical protein [Gordonia sp. ABSL11-1]